MELIKNKPSTAVGLLKIYKGIQKCKEKGLFLFDQKQETP